MAPPLLPSITATLADDILLSAKKNPGGTITYTAVITNGGSDASNVVFTDVLDSNTTLVGGSVKTTPIAFDDAYNVIGNVRIQPNAAAGLLANDIDPDTGTNVGLTASGPSSSTQGGNVTVNSDGSFSYNPPVAFTGTDTFTYTVTDPSGKTGTGTVTLTVSGMVWFINNNAAACTTLAAGCGRLANPFSTLAAFQGFNDNAAGHPKVNDNIFIFESASAYTGPVTLLSGQKLIGQDSTTSLSTLTGLTPQSYSNPFPTMNTGAPATTITSASNDVNLNSGNTLNGFTAGAATGIAISGSGFGTLTVADVIVNTTGQGLSLTNGTLAATFTSVTSSGGTNNIALATGGTTLAGTLTINGGALSGATGDSILVSGTGTSTATISDSGTIASGSAHSVNIANKTGGTVTFSGGITDAHTGITLTSNTGATINFTGGISASTTTNTAFNATGGGTVNATQNNTSIINTLTTTTGIALNVTSTTIGASGLTFRSISANGGTNGIVLVNTGSSGGLTVSGNGGSCDAVTPTCTGGRIQNTTGADFNSPAPANTTEPGVGVYLNNTRSVSLTRMHVNDNSNFAVYGVTVTGFTMNTGLIDGTNGTNNTTPINDGSMTFFGLTGTSSITNSTIKGGFQRNIRIENTSGTADITISGSTIRDTNTGVSGDDNLFIQAGTSANITAHVQNNTFAACNGDHIQTVAQEQATLNIVVTGNLLSGGGGVNALGQGITISGGNSTPVASTEHCNFNVSNNGTVGTPFTGNLQGGAININHGAGSGIWQGQVANNVIGDPAVANSGSTQSSGIRVENHGNGSLTAIVDSNLVRQWNSGPGINFQVGDTGNVNGALDLTVTNNTVSNPGASSQHGVVGNFGADSRHERGLRGH